MYVSDQLVTIGFAIVMIGIIILLVGFVSQTKTGKTKIEGGGIVFIGPFPIIGGATSKQAFYILLAASVVLTVFYLLSRSL